VLDDASAAMQVLLFCLQMAGREGRVQRRLSTLGLHLVSGVSRPPSEAPAPKVKTVVSELVPFGFECELFIQSDEVSLWRAHSLCARCAGA
jgi:hypothetical protein